MMDRGNSDEARSRLARAVLLFRTAAYASLLTIAVAVFVVNAGPLLWPVLIFGAALAMPLVFPSSDPIARIRAAVIADLLVSVAGWAYLPTDPTLPLVITLWAVTMAAFFLPARSERIMIGAVVTIEFLKWPLASVVFAGRFVPNSRLREYFASEWAINGAAMVGRIVIILGTYALFRSIAQFYRRSKEAVVESKQRYQALVESTPTALLVIQDAQLVFVSPAALELFGISDSSDIVGRKAADFIRPEDLERLRAVVAKTNQLEATAHFPGETIVLPDGSERIVDATFAPTTFESHPALNLMLIDATERYRANRVLSESEERYRQFFEELPVALYRTTRDGRIIDINGEAARLLGVPDRQSLIGRNARDFYVANSARVEFVNAIEDLGHVVGQETALRHSTGKIVWVRDSARRIETATGLIYEGAMVDITDRIMVERELRAGAAQQEAVVSIGHLALTQGDLPALFDAAAVAMQSQLDAEITGVLTRQGDGSYKLESGTGWPPGAAGNLIVAADAADHHEFVMEANGPILVESLEDERRFTPSPPLIERGAQTGATAQIPGSDGGRGVLGAYRKQRVPFSEDDVRFIQAVGNVVGAAIDRSEARQQLEQLVKSKDQFIATISHEVRTPLTVVAGLSYELRDRWNDFSDEEVTSLTALLVQQSQDMADLIEDLLVAARADIGKVEIRPELVNLGEEVKAVLAAIDRSHQVQIPANAADVKALADPVRLRQILRNLTSNAVKYGGPAISVSAATVDGRAVIEVRDDGTGIPIEERDRIFDAYHQAHERTGQTASVGLGLTVSRKLAEMMGGSLNYHHDGESVFVLTLPIP